MIYLCDRYDQASKDLHHTLLATGFDGPTIVMEPDGFLPDGVTSPFDAYLLEKDETGKALYFNQLPVPDFWEIQGDNSSARVLNHMAIKAYIHYVPDSYQRLVAQVDWLDEAGRMRQKDHYNCYGFCFAKTTYDQDGQAILTKYFNRAGLERILENHVTGHLILSPPDSQSRTYANRVAFTQAYIREQFGSEQPILFNSLAQSFLVSFYMEGNQESDILVWQEPLGQDLPGNMQGILADNDLRANTILIPDQSTYEQALSLVPKDKRHKIHQLGYVYDFIRENNSRKEALIATHSDQILHLEELVKALPDVTFHIAAITEMSAKLMAMMTYPNVRLYPNSSQAQLANLYQKADLYLDINRQGELQAATRQAFLNHQLILAFEETVHGQQVTAPDHVFAASEIDQMMTKIKQVLSDPQQLAASLEAQDRAGNAKTPQDLRRILDMLVKERKHD